MEIVRKQSFKIVGIQVTAVWDYLFTEVPHTWQRFKDSYSEITDKIDNRFMDICVKKEGNVFTQLIGVQVNDFGKIPETMIGLEFPESDYLYLKHRGRYTGIHESFAKVYKWAKENELNVDDFKIDYGYCIKETEPIEHSLYVKIL
jgi:predicted transcriptional regulator YdeE